MMIRLTLVEIIFLLVTAAALLVGGATATAELGSSKRRNLVHDDCVKYISIW